MTTEDRTAEFHEAFGHPVRNEPTTVDREEAILALRLIEEEFLELCNALFPGADKALSDWTAVDWIEDLPNSLKYEPDLLAVADALGDLDVVVNGAGLRHGLDMQSISRAVFASNMSKLGPDGKPIYREDGKILKGPDFREPNLAPFVEAAA